MSDRLQDVEKNTNLAHVGEAHGFKDFINGNPAQRGIIHPRLVQDTVEAIIGAAFIDGGIDGDVRPAKVVMTTLGLL